MERIKEATSKTFDRLNLPLPPIEGREGTAGAELPRAGLVNDPSVHPLIPEKTQDILRTVLRRYRMWAFPLPLFQTGMSFASFSIGIVITLYFIPATYYFTVARLLR